MGVHRAWTEDKNVVERRLTAKAPAARRTDWEKDRIFGRDEIVMLLIPCKPERQVDSFYLCLLLARVYSKNDLNIVNKLYRQTSKKPVSSFSRQEPFSVLSVCLCQAVTMHYPYAKCS